MLYIYACEYLGACVYISSLKVGASSKQKNVQFGLTWARIEVLRMNCWTLGDFVKRLGLRVWGLGLRVRG